MNKVELAGKIASEPEFSYKTREGERFFSFLLEVPRRSEQLDVLPCLVSELMIKKIKKDSFISLTGSIRTITRHKHVILNVFVETIGEYEEPINEVIVNDGIICRTPNYYVTSKQKRPITNTVMISNRKNGSPVYIPTIFWNRLAMQMAERVVGDTLSYVGRLQSRTYIKHLDNGSGIQKTTYEVSCMKLLEDIKDEEVVS